jgi:hypothetical protein
MYCLANALIRAAAADMASEGFINVRVGRRGIFCEQCGGGHNHACLAVATLRDLISEPGLLHGMLAVGRKPFDGDDAASSDSGDARGAGARGFAIHVDGTGAAERLAAAKFCAGESQGIAQDPKQGSIRRNLHGMLPAVYSDRNWFHAVLLDAPDVKRNSTVGAGEMQIVCHDLASDCIEITVSPDGAEKGKIKATEEILRELI